MRRFLYITPYFPPQSRVGALRPLKFARHLPDYGWAPVVLCDLWKSAKTDPDLLDAIPDSAIVLRRYSRRGQAAQLHHKAAWKKAAEARGDTDPERVPNMPVAPTPERRVIAAIPGWLNNPELIPLGEHSLRMPYALAQARRAARHFSCEAIVVNADPYAGCIVGARLADQTGLPLVLDMRDPWAHCELRRPRRPLPIRIAVDRLEQRAIGSAARVILNTRTTWHDYCSAYPHLAARGGRPGRFDWIRNHSDAELIADGRHPGFDRFTMLFLGNFGRFIKAEVLIAVLKELSERGITADDFQLVVTGRFPESALRMAAGMGVQGMIHLHEHVPYREIGAIMDAADLLLLLIQPRGRQRLAAKLFDYLASDRPILAISENEELGGMLACSGAGTMHPYADVSGIADRIQTLMSMGRHRTTPRRPIGATSKHASAKLASILDEVAKKER